MITSIKKRVSKSVIAIIMAMILTTMFSISAFAATGPVTNYQETIDLYGAGVGTTDDVIFTGSHLHVAAMLVNTTIPDGTVVNVYLVRGGTKVVYLFRLSSNGSISSTSSGAVSITPGTAYHIVLERAGSGYLPDVSQVSIGCSSYS